MAEITIKPWDAKLTVAISGKETPGIDTDSIAVAGTIVERTGRGEETTWTPLSSYLGEMRTKIAMQQLFDGLFGLIISKLPLYKY